jgi:hypothetical protein
MSHSNVVYSQNVQVYGTKTEVSQVGINVSVSESALMLQLEDGTGVRISLRNKEELKAIMEMLVTAALTFDWNSDDNYRSTYVYRGSTCVSIEKTIEALVIEDVYHGN